jgi:putative ABC transport system substrate-binding protein
MKRRTIIRAAASALAAALLSARGQQPDKVWRVGVLDPGLPHLFAAFRESMRGLGYVERGNIRFDERNANGNAELIPALARELVALKPDVIVTAAALPAHALLSETTTIPLVVASIGDAVSAGDRAQLARPTGNVTGLTFLNTELSGKRLELLKEALPQLHRVAVFNDVNSQRSYLDETESAAKRLGLQLHRVDLRTSAEFERAYAEAKQGADEAVDVLASPFFNAYRGRLVQLASRERLPAIYESREYAVAGGFMTYGQDLAVLFRRAATLSTGFPGVQNPPTLPGAAAGSSWHQYQDCSARHHDRIAACARDDVFSVVRWQRWLLGQGVPQALMTVRCSGVTV